MLPVTAGSLLSGFSAAAAVNAVHEGLRKHVKQAPRMDLVGKRGMRKLMHGLGKKAPRGRRLYAAAMAGDVASNAAYYALVGWGSRQTAIKRGLGLGILAGLGAVFLTPRLGLGFRPVRRSAQTAWMTFGYYVFGGLVAGSVQRLLPRG